MVIRHDDGSFEFWCEQCGHHILAHPDGKREVIEKGDPPTHNCQAFYVPASPTLALAVGSPDDDDATWFTEA